MFIENFIQVLDKERSVLLDRIRNFRFHRPVNHH